MQKKGDWNLVIVKIEAEFEDESNSVHKIMVTSNKERQLLINCCIRVKITGFYVTLGHVGWAWLWARVRNVGLP